VTLVSEAALVVFANLTLTDSDSYTGQCSHCDILMEVHYTPLLMETQNTPVTIDVNVTYGSLLREVEL